MRTTSVLKMTTSSLTTVATATTTMSMKYVPSTRRGWYPAKSWARCCRVGGSAPHVSAFCLQIWRPATRGDAGILLEMLQLGYFELTCRTNNEYFLMKSADLIQFINTVWIYSSWRRVTSLMHKVNFTWREMDASTLSWWSHSLGGSWIGQLIGELPALLNLGICLLQCGALCFMLFLFLSLTLS